MPPLLHYPYRLPAQQPAPLKQPQHPLPHCRLHPLHTCFIHRSPAKHQPLPPLRERAGMRRNEIMTAVVLALSNIAQPDYSRAVAFHKSPLRLTCALIATHIGRAFSS